MNNLLAHLGKFVNESILIREVYVHRPIRESHLVIRFVTFTMDDEIAFKAFFESSPVVSMGTKHVVLKLLLPCRMISQKVWPLTCEMATPVLLCLGSRNVVRSIKHIFSIYLHISSLACRILGLLSLYMESSSRVASLYIICNLAGDCWFIKHFMNEALSFFFLVDNVDIQTRDFGSDSPLGHRILVCCREGAR